MIDFNTILILVGLLVVLMTMVIACSFGGMLLGAFIHHRGVSIGGGNRESFTGKAPKGEFFRIDNIDDAMEDEFPDGDVDTGDESLNKTFRGRAKDLVGAMGLNRL